MEFEPAPFSLRFAAQRAGSVGLHNYGKWRNRQSVSSSPREQHAMKRIHPAQHGFAAIAAIFLVVVLAALGGFMLTFSNTQQLTSAQDIQGSRAYWAARAGLEWAVVAIPATPALCPSPVTAGPPTVDGFALQIDCSSNTYTEGGASPTIYRFQSRASLGSAPGSIGFIERSVSAVALAAAPTFQAVGAEVGGEAAVSPAWPTHAVNDIALLFVESAGGEEATLSTAAGFVRVTGSPQATGTGTAGTRITVFWARATSTKMGAPTVADPGDHVYAQIITYRGVINTGAPWDVTDGGVKAAAADSVTVTSVTTTVVDTLIVQAVARHNNSAAEAFGVPINTNLTSITVRFDAGTDINNGGGFAVWDGGKATAGATGDTTATVTLSINAFLTIALKRGTPLMIYRRENY